ncbi:meiotically up-regulated gene 157 (Mug157) protein [Paenibacillus sp. SORGH_AS306]|nr:meiotically up-regulated gene 157 (Mug157) protein [Paenibacillus sp. SORGH_AS_0306]
MLEKLEHVQMSTFELPQAVQDVLAEAEQTLAHRPKLAELFRNCFPNTLETTTKLMDDGTTFVITGDIPAMWLRDSVEQLIHYVPLCKEDKDLQRMISGLIKRHMFYLEIDPYANSFNETANDWHWDPADETRDESVGMGAQVRVRFTLFYDSVSVSLLENKREYRYF